MKNMYTLFCIWVTFSWGITPMAAQHSITCEPVPVVEDQGAPVSEDSNPEPDPVFFSHKKDLLILACSGALAIGDTLLKYCVPPLTEAQLAALDPASGNSFDRVAIRQYRVAIFRNKVVPVKV